MSGLAFCTSRKRRMHASVSARVKTVAAATCISHYDPGLAPVPVPVAARARSPCLAACLLCPAGSASAARAEMPPVVAAARGGQRREHPAGGSLFLRARPVFPVVAARFAWSVPDAEPPGVPVAVTERAGRGLAQPAGVVRHAGCPAAWNRSSLAPFAQPAPGSVAALRGHGAGSGNSAAAAIAAVPLGADSVPRNTAADRRAAGQAPGPRCGSICPSRSCAVPSHGPSDHPSAAAHRTSNIAPSVRHHAQAQFAYDHLRCGEMR